MFLFYRFFKIAHFMSRYKGLSIWHLELENPLTLPALDSLPVCGKSKKFPQSPVRQLPLGSSKNLVIFQTVICAATHR